MPMFSIVREPSNRGRGGGIGVCGCGVKGNLTGLIDFEVISGICKFLRAIETAGPLYFGLASFSELDENARLLEKLLCLLEATHRHSAFQLIYIRPEGCFQAAHCIDHPFLNSRPSLLVAAVAAFVQIQINGRLDPLFAPVPFKSMTE